MRAMFAGYSALLSRVYRCLWQGPIQSVPPEIPPGSLILAAHYNGAIDGISYGSQLPAYRAVISSQWHRWALGRWLLPGIAVTRAKDGSSPTGNAGAFRQMLTTLKSGERLLFFPEGTSQLGQKRLPVQPGTLLLLRGLRSISRDPQVVFTAAHYHEPTRWKSSVSIGWVGPLPLASSSEHDEAWVTQHLLAAQRAAYARRAPRKEGWTVCAALLALPYLPVWALVGWLARRTADGENVIALWKFLFGVPLTGLAFAAYCALAWALGFSEWIPLGSLVGGWLLWNQ